MMDKSVLFSSDMGRMLQLRFTEFHDYLDNSISMYHIKWFNRKNAVYDALVQSIRGNINTGLQIVVQTTS